MMNSFFEIFLFHFINHLDFISSLTYSLFWFWFWLWVSDPNVHMMYKMEVLRDAESKIRPLFRVTLDNGEEVSYDEVLKPPIHVYSYYLCALHATLLI